jgi:hypothetical protein
MIFGLGAGLLYSGAHSEKEYKVHLMQICCIGSDGYGARMSVDNYYGNLYPSGK